MNIENNVKARSILFLRKVILHNYSYTYNSVKRKVVMIVYVCIMYHVRSLYKHTNKQEGK